MSNQINKDDDPQKIVDDAIARMMAGTVVKEEKRSNYVVDTGATSVAIPESVRYTVDAVILPGMQSGDGLLGMRFLKNLKIVQNNSKMVITQQ